MCLKHKPRHPQNRKHKPVHTSIIIKCHASKISNEKPRHILQETEDYLYRSKHVVQGSC